MIIIIEIVILCIAFFLICFWGTGTDNKNLRLNLQFIDFSSFMQIFPVCR